MKLTVIESYFPDVLNLVGSIHFLEGDLAVIVKDGKHFTIIKDMVLSELKRQKIDVLYNNPNSITTQKHRIRFHLKWQNPGLSEDRVFTIDHNDTEVYNREVKSEGRFKGPIYGRKDT